MESSLEKKLINTAVHQCIDAYIDESQSRFELTVSGDCMSPILSNDDKLLIERKTNYRIGDVVAFFSPIYDRYFVHRVLGVVPFKKTKRYFIKADQAKYPDVIVEQNDILGLSVNTTVSIMRRVYCFLLLLLWITRICYKKIVNALG